MKKEQIHNDICKKIHETYIKKNHDYGDSVKDTYDKFGIDAFLVRMYDKMNRLYALTRKNAKTQVEDEKIEDTLLDLANYAIITLVEKENNKSQGTMNSNYSKIIDNSSKESYLDISEKRLIQFNKITKTVNVPQTLTSEELKSIFLKCKDLNFYENN